ncbi:glycosyl transferase family A [Pandoraea pulmonicola]|nr:glycosyl transferase family A [Pandoraea pulmonicola]
MSRLMARREPPASVASQPFVSVVTPTWRRREFLPYLLYIFQYQDYPVDRRELIILDDSEESNQDLVDQLIATCSNKDLIRYYHVEERLTLGQKRNRLNELARGEYIVCMDDDDYYPADKISHVVAEMQRHNAPFSGCDQIYLWYSHIDKIYRSARWGPGHALNGTFAYHRDFLKRHRYDDSAKLAEEASFLNGFSVPVLQMDPRRAILCISHNANTYDKDFILGNCERVDLSLDDLVEDPHLRKHYRRLSHAPVSARVRWEFFERIVVLHSSADPSILAEFRETLHSLGCDPAHVEVHHPEDPRHDAANHLAIAERARREGWRNFLLLDDRVEFVRKERTVNNVNGLLGGLGSIEWQIVMLGADFHHGKALQSLPGVLKVNAATQAVAYGVNRGYYDVWISFLTASLELQRSQPDNPSFRTDRLWLHPMQAGRWLSIYPSFAYRSNDDDGRDLAAGFFRKIDCSGSPRKIEDASQPIKSKT